MNEHVYLLKPTKEFKVEYLSYFTEWRERGEEVIPWVVSKDPTDFEGMVQELLDAEQGINLPQGWVPDSTYWLFREEDEKILGVTNIRHSLTEHLMNAGGHIGYGIRPSERRKGYAKKILELSLEKTD
ncbi:putative acetyltransferase [Bacillus tianshenii]|uniref:Acetyltransferase n=1 Tax=Sutcliffiella tianshenii TaxID=1463404 RepID=A0ABS2P2E5_9BACI|nr:putative acetyltransferase [Bacillus tianshenii]